MRESLKLPNHINNKLTNVSLGITLKFPYNGIKCVDGSKIFFWKVCLFYIS